MQRRIGGSPRWLARLSGRAPRGSALELTPPGGCGRAHAPSSVGAMQRTPVGSCWSWLTVVAIAVLVAPSSTAAQGEPATDVGTVGGEVDDVGAACAPT